MNSPASTEKRDPDIIEEFNQLSRQLQELEKHFRR
jgi:hypothetical protein